MGLSDEIVPDDELHRRVVSFNVKPDNTINASAFKLRRPKRPDPEISVDLARMTTAEQCLAVGGIPGLGGCGAQGIRTGEFRLTRSS
jgi:hypothetical protein